MKQHIKKWMYLYMFYLVAIPNFFVRNSAIKLGLIGVMIFLLIMFYRSTVNRIYRNK